MTNPTPGQVTKPCRGLAEVQGRQLPSSYVATLAEAKAAMQSARARGGPGRQQRTIGLYWQLGRLILERQRDEGWGTKVIERLPADEQAALPAEADLVEVLDAAVEKLGVDSEPT